MSGGCHTLFYLDLCVCEREREREGGGRMKERGKEKGIWIREREGGVV